MSPKRKTHSETFNARVAVEAIKGVRTLSELSAAHGVHPTVIAHWKRQLLDGAPEVFRRGLAGTGRSEEVMTAPLYQEIGRLKMELEWLKKICKRVAGHPPRLDRRRPGRGADCPAVCGGRAGTLDLLLRASPGAAGESGADAAAR
jgi:transposase